MSLNNDSRFTSIIECFDLVILTNRGASNKRILATGRIALQNICTDLESLRNEIASLRQSLEALQQSHTLQATELSASTNKCTGLEGDILQLRDQVQAQAQQINEKNKSIKDGVESLQKGKLLEQ